MVLLALPPADHLLIERDRGQFVPSRRRRHDGQRRLLKIPAEPSPELRIPNAAAQTRVVSMAGIRLGCWESARAFKGIICDDISEFEPYMPSQAGRSAIRAEDASSVQRPPVVEPKASRSPGSSTYRAGAILRILPEKLSVAEDTQIVQERRAGLIDRLLNAANKP